MQLTNYFCNHFLEPKRHRSRQQFFYESHPFWSSYRPNIPHRIHCPRCQTTKNGTLVTNLCGIIPYPGWQWKNIPLTHEWTSPRHSNTVCEALLRRPVPFYKLLVWIWISALWDRLHWRQLLSGWVWLEATGSTWGQRERDSALHRDALSWQCGLIWHVWDFWDKALWNINDLPRG